MVSVKRPRLSAGRLKKSDILWIMKQRQTWWRGSDSRLRTMKKEDLEAQLDPEPTQGELEALNARNQRNRSLFPKLKTEELKGRLGRLGVPYSGLDKGELAEKLDDTMQKGKTVEPDLDTDQQAVIDRWKDRELIVNAGPGSGKTTTLCALITHILRKRPNSRVLVLAFNRCASSELTSRLRKRGTKLLRKTDAFKDSLLPGCLVSTFDSFGFWSIPGTEEKLKKVRSTDYRLHLEQSAKILGVLDKENPARIWNWLIVDEAQDLNDTHAKMVETLRETPLHLVVAGDPRQEVYPGAVWFSNLWTNTKSSHRAKLRFNYRSAPEIVEILNTYSRANFPDLHHDQVAKQKTSGTVEFCMVQSPDECGETVGERLCKSSPQDAYAIGPVTIKKFLTEPVTNTIRQVVHELKPGSHIFVFGEMNLPSSKISDVNAYVLGTSRGLKGTERSRVVIYGITAPFTDYGIAQQALAKLMYVAISRAKNHLHIIADRYLPVESPLTCFRQFPTYRPTVKREMFLPQVICVTDLAEESYTWSKLEEPTPVDDPLEPIETESVADADFVGLYLESVVAHCAGLMTEDESFQRKNERKFRQHDFYVDNDRFIFNVPGSINENLTEYMKKVLEQGRRINPCYSLTVVRTSLEIGRPWTVSSRLEGEWKEHRAACEPYAKKIRHLLLHSEASDLLYQHRKDLSVKLHRSDAKPAGTVVGVSDFSSESAVVEVKYVHTVTTTHRSQAAMYAALHSVPYAFLVNLRSGQVEKIAAVRRKELANLARAKLALQAARRVAASATVYSQMPLPPKFVRTCCIVVDVETDGANSMVAKPLMTEIGAVAFNMDGHVLGTFHRVLRGVEATSGPANESDTESDSEKSDYSPGSGTGSTREEEVLSSASSPLPTHPDDPYTSGDNMSSASSPLLTLSQDVQRSLTRGAFNRLQYASSTDTIPTRRPALVPGSGTTGSFSACDMYLPEYDDEIDLAGTSRGSVQRSRTLDVPQHFLQKREEEGEEEEEEDEDECQDRFWRALRSKFSQPTKRCNAHERVDEDKDDDEVDNEDNTADDDASVAYNYEDGLPRRVNNLLQNAFQAIREAEKQLEQNPPSTDPIEDNTTERARQDGTVASFIEQLTGLKITDRQKLTRDQLASVGKFHRWVNRVSGLRCFIHWGGDEPGLLNLKLLGYCQDMVPLYRAWLKHKGMERKSGLTLTDCVNQTMGPAWPFEPHRAFEDAVATSAVLTVLAEHS